ncbi:MAG: Gx transporter family protein [Gammaproteobacteria bacterium]|nr:Gx transporter family protein [Gammaproteobacteria bacterium]
MSIRLSPSLEDHRIAKLAAISVGIAVIEAAIPSPLPGIKPGLANIIAIAVYFLLGWRAAAWVSILRILVSGLILGTFLSPGFILSVAGGVSSLIALALLSHIGKLGLSPVGVAILAALAHSLGQFVVAYWLFVPHPGLFYLLPVFLTAALVFGLISGFLSQMLITKYRVQHEFS